MTFGEIIENAFDCKTCGTKGISALKHKTCPMCGAAAPGPEFEYIPDVNHPLTDDADLALARQSADWTCRFCGTRNRADKAECTQCGNAQGEADQTASTIDYGTNAPSGAPAVGEPYPKQSVRDPAASMSPVKRSAKWINIGIAAVLLLVVAGIGVVLYLHFHIVDVQGQVSGFSWSRVVNIDRYQTDEKTGRVIPPGGRYISQAQVIDHYNDTYRTVTTHVSKTCYRNNGNGSSTRYDCSYNTSHQELVSHIPVYVTMYTYNIDEWVPYRNVNATGQDRNPYWPQYVLAYYSQQVIGAERVNHTDETYTVNFINPQAKNSPVYAYTTNQTEWMQYALEITYPLKVNGTNTIVNDPLQDKLNIQAKATASTPGTTQPPPNF